MEECSIEDGERIWQLGGLIGGVVVVVMEVGFYVYCQYKIQRYNKQIHSIPYRDHPKDSDRKKLLQSLLSRISNVTTFLQSWSATSNNKKKDEDDGDDDVWMDTLLDCMGDTQGVITSLPSLERTHSIDSSSSVSNSSSSSSDGYRNVAEFLSWALYHESYEKKQNQIHELMTDMIGPKLNVPHDWSFFEEDKFLCMSFEPLIVWHRPLLFYTALACIRYCSTTLLLRSFTKVTTPKSHFTYWYKASNNNKAKKTIIFFHGIAPGGLTLYLPFLYHTILSTKDANVMLVELDAIASCIPMSTKFELEEEQTVQEILHALQRHSITSTPIVLVGHSFGSCPITWLTQSKTFRTQCIIDTILLLEPVSILLSEPHVMTNFLYTAEQMSVLQFIIRGMASCELGIQSYLRRQFAWYNCELQLPTTIPTIVCLAANDTIVPSSTIQSELTKYKNITTFYWDNERHGGCILKPYLWSKIHQILQNTIQNNKRAL